MARQGLRISASFVVTVWGWRNHETQIVMETENRDKLGFLEVQRQFKIEKVHAVTVVG